MLDLAANGLPKAVLFDLDGTLIDSAPDIAAAVNELLIKNGLGPLETKAVRMMIGNGLEKLVERAFEAAGQPLMGESKAQAFAEMNEIYSRHLTIQTVLMPGALKTVPALAGRGLRVAVISNKPQVFTDAILDFYELSHALALVQGAVPGLAKKPAPDMLAKVLESLKLGPNEALFVGDSRADVEAARAVGLSVVLVRGGYSQEPLENLGADHIFDNLEQLLRAFESAN